MPTAIPEKDLPDELGLLDAVAAAYPGQLAETVGSLARRVPVLVECEKELAPYAYANLR